MYNRASRTFLCQMSALYINNSTLKYYYAKVNKIEKVQLVNQIFAQRAR